MSALFEHSPISTSRTFTPSGGRIAHLKSCIFYEKVPAALPGFFIPEYYHFSSPTSPFIMKSFWAAIFAASSLFFGSVSESSSESLYTLIVSGTFEVLPNRTIAIQPATVDPTSSFGFFSKIPFFKYTNGV